MHVPTILNRVNGKMVWEKFNLGLEFLRNVGKLLFHPGTFYKALSADKGFGTALGFLVSSSILFGFLASLFIPQRRLLYGTIFSLNAITMPPVMALILFFVTLIGSKKVFTYRILFGITAYSNITLILAWIPGLSWATGLWRFYLIGLGMVTWGNISPLKAFITVAVTAAVLLSFIYFLQPFSP
jgi:hypothetical protein